MSSRIVVYYKTPPPNPLPATERGSKTHDPSSSPSPLRGGGWGGGVFGPPLPKKTLCHVPELHRRPDPANRAGRRLAQGRPQRAQGSRQDRYLGGRLLAARPVQGQRQGTLSGVR